MPLPAKAFQHWLNRAAPGFSTAEICRVSGIKRSTLAQQLVRGKVAAATVVGISRGLGRSPLDDLASFEKYADLKGKRPPTPAELVSQVATMDLLRAVVARSGPAHRSSRAVDAPEAPDVFSPAPHPTSVRNWVDAVDDGELRHRVAAATGIAPQNFSAQLTANRLSPELTLATARAAGVGFTGGLVATGLITEAEAGWDPAAKQSAVASLSDGELVTLAGERLQTLGKALHRQEQELAQTQKIWENLG
ncbi:hypothetical protein [Arthrobacter sp. PAMC25284]|uniref:hypothetical protein n=1 Tax=Arthrobacter sp. PAMC25284 TaxID=2861279 RepID=UPI001C633F3C|nr:hypothetical protein [Arthrobacter sp. PAMC25284]QYF91203.1 hypothetical protein KY499_08525 [Arthrobacter sp. PAMC25284]